MAQWSECCFRHGLSGILSKGQAGCPYTAYEASVQREALGGLGGFDAWHLSRLVASCSSCVGSHVVGSRANRSGCESGSLSWGRSRDSSEIRDHSSKSTGPPRIRPGQSTSATHLPPSYLPTSQHPRVWPAYYTALVSLQTQFGVPMVHVVSRVRRIA